MVKAKQSQSAKIHMVKNLELILLQHGILMAHIMQTIQTSPLFIRSRTTINFHQKELPTISIVMLVMVPLLVAITIFTQLKIATRISTLAPILEQYTRTQIIHLRLSHLIHYQWDHSKITTSRLRSTKYGRLILRLDLNNYSLLF